MKTFLTAALLLAGSCLVQAQQAYTSAMLKNIDAIYHSNTIDEYQVSVNAFERIAVAEKTKYEPYYYVAFGNIMMAVNESVATRKDDYLNVAAKAVAKANELHPNDSEVVTLEGFVHMIRVTVDPASRGQEYSGKAFNAFDKAVSLNPENPRALAMLGQMQLGTAKFFGSDPSEGCATTSKALEKFDTFKPANSLAPRWGKAMAEGVKANCK